ncbi:MAG: S41 family peptidase, partial [Flavobacteriales bacterium]|nr:S41 family peptidase [Flavobacteriales bacterium]
MKFSIQKVFNRTFLSILSIFIGLSINSNAQSPNELAESIQKIESLMRLVDRSYVDTVDNAGLTEKMIKSFLKELDPHSVYISKKDVQKMNEPLVGNFEGVGIQFNILEDTIMVVSPISGGPSEKLGIQSGDRIVKVDGELVAGIGVTNKMVMDKLRGKKGTTVQVSIFRRGESDLIDYSIERDKIPIYSVDAGYMVKPGIGYIKLNRFAGTSMREIREKLDTLEKAGMQSLILDLRGNSGGYLQTAIDLADEFLSNRKLIVYTEGRSFPKNEKFATSNGRFEQGKLVVLVDNGSASASEIVSGAVQDWDR